MSWVRSSDLLREKEKARGMEGVQNKQTDMIYIDRQILLSFKATNSTLWSGEYEH
jgi:hypothetical protein